MAKPLTARGSTRPIPTIKSKRRDEWRGLTSMKAGVIVPIAFFPMLREDRARGSIIGAVENFNRTPETGQSRFRDQVRFHAHPNRVDDHVKRFFRLHLHHNGAARPIFPKHRKESDRTNGAALPR